MIDQLLPYSDMKPAGLRWLPTIPKHWDVRRLKTLLREIDERSTTGREPLLSLRMHEGVVDHVEAGGKPLSTQDLIGYKVVMVKPGALIMNRMRAAMGLFGIAPCHGLVSPDYAIFYPRNSTDVRYLLHLFKTPMLGDVFRAESKGLGTGEAGFLRLYTDRFGAIAVPTPPAQEQRLIARLLDWHGGLTSKLIRGSQRRIALLQEQLQSIIHKGITRGIDDSVALRWTAGISWLGEIPSHWELKKLKHLTRFYNGLAFKPSDWKESGVPIIRIQNLNGSNVFNNTDQQDLPNRLRIKPGDLLFSWSGNRGTSFGPFLWDRDFEGYLNQHIFKLEGYSLSKAYFAYLLRAVTKHIEDETHGIIGLVHITKPELGSVVVPVAPPPEQEQIAKWIDNHTQELRAAIDYTKREVLLIRELRVRVIADIVTGRFDVRSTAAALPEQISEPLHEIDVDDELDDESTGDDWEEAAA